LGQQPDGARFNQVPKQTSTLSANLPYGHCQRFDARLSRLSPPTSVATVDSPKEPGTWDCIRLSSGHSRCNIRIGICTDGARDERASRLLVFVPTALNIRAYTSACMIVNEASRVSGEIWQKSLVAMSSWSREVKMPSLICGRNLDAPESGEIPTNRLRHPM
jgi:hypothetical protein